MDGYRRLALGREGERLAAAFLEAAGLTIVERDVRLRNGQVDLVALDGDRLVVVEVKARRGHQFGRPEEAVDWRKLARLRELAETYRTLHPHVGLGLRIDVVAVDIGPAGDAVDVRHIRDVS